MQIAYLPVKTILKSSVESTFRRIFPTKLTWCLLHWVWCGSLHPWCQSTDCNFGTQGNVICDAHVSSFNVFLSKKKNWKTLRRTIHAHHAITLYPLLFKIVPCFHLLTRHGLVFSIVPISLHSCSSCTSNGSATHMLSIPYSKCTCSDTHTHSQKQPVTEPASRAQWLLIYGLLFIRELAQQSRPGSERWNEQLETVRDECFGPCRFLEFRFYFFRPYLRGHPIRSHYTAGWNDDGRHRWLVQRSPKAMLRCCTVNIRRPTVAGTSAEKRSNGKMKNGRKCAIGGRKNFISRCDHTEWGNDSLLQRAALLLSRGDEMIVARVEMDVWC